MFIHLGVVLENVILQLDANSRELSENNPAFNVNFDLGLRPHISTSILPDGGTHHWDVEIFSSNKDASVYANATKRALTRVTIPSTELSKGVDRPGIFVIVLQALHLQLHFFPFTRKPKVIVVFRQI